MANLKEIKRRIQSVKNTQQITKAMKLVAASKLRKAQQAILDARPYAIKMMDVVNHLAARIAVKEIEPYSSLLLRIKGFVEVLTVPLFVRQLNTSKIMIRMKTP